MKYSLLFLILALSLLLACNKTFEAETTNTPKPKATKENSNDLEETELNESEYEVPPPNTRFGKSQIINSRFDPKLIFGVWTHSHKDPACEFEINEKRLLLCDYDGDGERLYRIENDSLLLDNPWSIFRGKIVSVNKDTMVIHWQENESPEILLKWKD